ncbi:MAG: CCA tRNA nucleotidyltransferase [Alphaproteobacteria bacterium]|nr:MAG: CCA tRNA nucleotidyltransferase [Alphaproteobacteria bacterium]
MPEPTRIAGPWLTDPATRAVLDAVAGPSGDPVYFVGGCVRDAVLGARVGDIDLATPVRPEEVMRRARAAGLRAVATGIDHGTVTVVAGHRGFEVTTFRRDVSTDGRRAVVAFSDDIREDAARRDFTMNAVYADPGGRLVDPLDARFDLFARIVRFVGDPHRRITEDYLRILRFFRMLAWHGDPARPPDPAGLAACAAHAGGLARIARERIGAEMRRLLAAPDPAPALAAMAASGVLGAVLPGADAAKLSALVAAERAAGVPPAWLRRLAALAPGADAAERLRLSRAEARALAAIGAALARPEPPAARAHRHGAGAARDAILIEAAEGSPPPEGWRQDLARGAAARFPLSGRDLAAHLPPGPALGAELDRLREAWIAADFRLDRAALIARITPGGGPADR